MTRRPICKILIAARGEIAVRVARACDELGIGSVAAASEADANALHARAAGERVVIGPAPARASYLSPDLLIEAARQRGCDAVHPGYGFLAQSPDFARRVEEAGMRFIGPPTAAMRLMGDKIASRRAMEKAGVPVLPGFAGSGDEGAETLKREAERLRTPFLVKAAGGGGGRGMRLVRDPADLPEAIDGARREAAQAFGDERLLLERYVDDARHVEVQVLCDTEGACVHLFERECSVQRRFQKIVEESPSPVVDAALRERLGATAVAAARACGYVNAGTVEFVVAPDGAFHFLEMNTRIQVEHPVTEMVTGVDLVKAQIRIAGGERLPFAQGDLRMSGHAIECRVVAEDPARDFAPSAGPVLHASFPPAPGIRVDPGVETGDEVTVHYDGLLAKVIAHAEDRASAIRRLDRALSRSAILGVATNLQYLRAILAHPVFLAGRATTAFTSRELAAWRPPERKPPDEAFVLMAIAETLGRAPVTGGGPGAGAPAAGTTPGSWGRLDGFRPGAG